MDQYGSVWISTDQYGSVLGQNGSVRICTDLHGSVQDLYEISPDLYTDFVLNASQSGGTLFVSTIHHLMNGALRFVSTIHHLMNGSLTDRLFLVTTK